MSQFILLLLSLLILLINNVTCKPKYKPTYMIPVDPIGNIYGYTAQPWEAQWLTHPADPWSRPSMSPMLGWHGVAQGPHPRMIGTTYRTTRNYRLNYLNNLPMLRYMHHPQPTQLTQWNSHHRGRDTLRYNPTPPKYFTFLELSSQILPSNIPYKYKKTAKKDKNKFLMDNSLSSKIYSSFLQMKMNKPAVVWPPKFSRSDVDKANAAVMERLFGSSNPGKASDIRKAPPVFVDHAKLVGASPDWLPRFHQYEASKKASQSGNSPKRITTTIHDINQMRLRQLHTLERARSRFGEKEPGTEEDDKGPMANGPGSNQWSIGKMDVPSIAGQNRPQIDGRYYHSVWSVESPNFFNKDAIRENVDQAAKLEGADKPNQRPYLWMPPSSHADVGQNIWPRYPRNYVGK